MHHFIGAPWICHQEVRKVKSHNVENSKIIWVWIILCTKYLVLILEEGIPVNSSIVQGKLSCRVDYCGKLTVTQGWHSLLQIIHSRNNVTCSMPNAERKPQLDSHLLSGGHNRFWQFSFEVCHLFWGKNYGGINGFWHQERMDKIIGLPCNVSMSISNTRKYFVLISNRTKKQKGVC
jgi:hypothetical protein